MVGGLCVGYVSVGQCCAVAVVVARLWADQQRRAVDVLAHTKVRVMISAGSCDMPAADKGEQQMKCEWGSPIIACRLGWWGSVEDEKGNAFPHTPVLQLVKEKGKKNKKQKRKDDACQLFGLAVYTKERLPG
eukprot:570066-Pelagomonas_calceolata.AAC.4